MAHILIAEDDPSMRQFLALALERAGHELTCCEDGLAALAALEDNSAFDLLLADIVMPGMDGIELAQKAAIIAPGMKIMFITGFAAVALGQYGGQYGDTAPVAGSVVPETKVLAKPFHLKELVDQVEALLAA